MAARSAAVNGHFRVLRRRAATMTLFQRAGALLLVASVAVAQQNADVAATLATIADGSTIEITTTGRKTGKAHTRPIWFVVDGSRILVQAGKGGKTDWYENLLANPSAVLRSGDVTLRARATPVSDPARIEQIHGLFLAKYRTAWLLSFFGSSIGRGSPMELTPESVGSGDAAQRGSTR
jgi:deazaflavin-dependent oxidoreductase (nitroreductase family)